MAQSRNNSSRGGAPRGGGKPGGGARGPQGRGKGSKAGPKGGFRSGPKTGPQTGPKSGPGKPKASAGQKGPQKPRAFGGVDKYERRASAIKEHGPHRRRRPKNPPVDRLEAHDENGVRLQKLMAQAGVASRRVCEEMIEAGLVQVNGETITELGIRVDPDTVEIHVDGVRVQLDENLVYYAFNKPEGEIGRAHV